MALLPLTRYARTDLIEILLPSVLRLSANWPLRFRLTKCVNTKKLKVLGRPKPSLEYSRTASLPNRSTAVLLGSTSNSKCACHDRRIDRLAAPVEAHEGIYIDGLDQILPGNGQARNNHQRIRKSPQVHGWSAAKPC